MEIIKNNTTINEDEKGICYYCGESHNGKVCPNSEYYTTEDNNGEEPLLYPEPNQFNE